MPYWVKTNNVHSDKSSCANCVFPFTFYDVEYTGCTTIGGPRPWCSTRVNENGVHVGGHWENCGSECPTGPKPTMSTEPPSTTPTDKSSCGNCVFPFTFWDVEYTACTTIDGDPKPWCSTRVNENGVYVGGYWEYCGSECPFVASPTRP